jgi:hypothetical protein
VLQGKSRGKHRRHSEQRREERIETEPRSQCEDGECGQHDEIAVGEIDQSHDAEDQRKAGGEQRIEASEQSALNDRAEPIEHVQCPK